MLNRMLNIIFQLVEYYKINYVNLKFLFLLIKNVWKSNKKSIKKLLKNNKKIN